MTRELHRFMDLPLEIRRQIYRQSHNLRSPIRKDYHAQAHPQRPSLTTILGWVVGNQQVHIQDAVVLSR